MAVCGPETFALRIAKFSQCPSSHHWLPGVASHVTESAEGAVLLNVGANKGYDLVTFLQWYTPSELTKEHWHTLVTAADGVGNSSTCLTQCCGVCGSCGQRRPSGSPWARPANVVMHAFEPVPTNRALLARVVAATGVPAHVHALAVGNASAPLYVEARSAGFEGTTPIAAAAQPRRDVVQVAQTTIDGFMGVRSLRRAHHVLIDAEGWDGLVLAGMRQVRTAEFQSVPNGCALPCQRQRRLLGLPAKVRREALMLESPPPTDARFSSRQRRRV